MAAFTDVLFVRFKVDDFSKLDTANISIGSDTLVMNLVMIGVGIYFLFWNPSTSASSSGSRTNVSGSNSGLVLFR